MSSNLKVVIIGAGAAGYAAACRLLEHGVDHVTVLEAEDRIGGRINTVMFGNSLVELGAQWCHGQDRNIVYHLAKDYNVLRPSLNMYMDFRFIDSKGALIDPGVTKAMTDLAFGIYSDTKSLQSHPGSLGDYVSHRFWNGLKSQNVDRTIAEMVLEWFHKFSNSLNGSHSWTDVSSPGLRHYEECDGDHTLNWGDVGYKTVFSLLDKSIPDVSKKLPIEDKIHLNREVVKVSLHESAGATVTCSDGSRYEANHVIFTCSLAVLKKKHRQIFEPQLPTKKRIAIDSLCIGTVNKIFLEYSESWWPSDFFGFSFVWRKEDSKNLLAEFPYGPSNNGRSWLEDLFGFYPVDSNPRALLGWMTGPTAADMELLTDEIVVRGCHFLLSKFVGKMQGARQPVAMVRSSWGTNPHFGGSYSYRGVETENAGAYAADLAAPVARNQLLFAGEATHSHFYSTVHGAVESGWREADRILAWAKPGPFRARTGVAVVGAGVAGLGAAHALMDARVDDFLLLEAKSVPGGRVHTVQFGDGYLDMGAQWLHGNNTDLWTIAFDRGLVAKSSPVREGLGDYVKPGGRTVDASIIDRVASVVQEALDECDKWLEIPDGYSPSIGDHLNQVFRRFIDEARANGTSSEEIGTLEDLFDWHMRFHLIDNACSSWHELSARSWATFEYPSENLDHSHDSLVGGLATLVDVLVQRLPPGKLLTSKPVDKIKWSGGKVQLLCSDGGEVIADCAIVTVSLGFLKEQMSTMFEPALPERIQRAVRFLGFGNICKVFLQFEECWWPSGGVQLIWSHDEPYADDFIRYMTGFDPVFGRSDVIVGWVGSAGADLVESLSSKEVGRKCVDALRKFTGDDTIPYPTKTTRTKWCSDRWTRGAYSHTTSACDSELVGPKDLCVPVNDENGRPVLVFAGEACHPSYYSTVHGAFQSGKDQAHVLLAGLQPVHHRAKM